VGVGPGVIGVEAEGDQGARVHGHSREPSIMYHGAPRCVTCVHLLHPLITAIPLCALDTSPSCVCVTTPLGAMKT